MRGYRFILLSSLVFLQMCRVVNGYYTDEDGNRYISHKFEDRSGFSLHYFYDNSSGLLNLDHTDREEYDQYFDGYYSSSVNIYCSDIYKIAYFKLFLTDVETNGIINEDLIIFGDDIPVEKYYSIDRLINEKTDKTGISFNVLYKKEKIENLKKILIKIQYAFYRNGELIEGEYKKVIYRKSRFKLG
ncbi:MAG: hypothetical protein KAZ87_10365 [Spirochaetes bacterium]|nr:hypothetical protein [Spirochaetota bacterium]